MTQTSMLYRISHFHIRNVLEANQTKFGFDVLISNDITQPGTDVCIEFELLETKTEQHSHCFAEINFFETPCWAMILFRDKVYCRGGPHNNRIQLTEHDGGINTPANIAKLHTLIKWRMNE